MWVNFAIKILIEYDSTNDLHLSVIAISVDTCLLELVGVSVPLNNACIFN